MVNKDTISIYRNSNRTRFFINLIMTSTVPHGGTNIVGPNQMLHLTSHKYQGSFDELYVKLHYSGFIFN